MLNVQKFGGTSLMDTQRIFTAAKRAVTQAQKGNQVVVVVSAQGNTTDRLVAAAQAVAPHPSLRELDVCLASGEQMSAALMAMAIAETGGRAVSLTGWQAGLLTDGIYGNARVKGLSNCRILQELESGNIVVVAGFQGVDTEGNITTLGRGGSDTTAVALAAFLHADLCQIYTDVDGVYDKDPRKDPAAVKFSEISYAEMLALARQGAQVLHDRCVELAQEHGVKIQVLSSFRPGEGTLVTD
jgi:aspartate kinase